MKFSPAIMRNRGMLKKVGVFTLIIVASVWCNFILFGMENNQMPPAKVVVSEVRSGTIIPEVEFIGTVYYPQVSNVASEVSGKVDRVNFEEGDRVKKGHILVKINSELLRKDIQTKKALHEHLLTDLDLARRDFKRIEKLFREETVAEQVYDEHKFKVAGLEKKSASITAEIEKLNVELQKKIARAPFDGVITKKLIDTGEWLSPGTPVATIARDDVVDVVFNVPMDVFSLVSLGKSIHVKISGLKIPGKILTVIPQGDIPTRTFPIKIRVDNSASLVAGMEAKVRLPRGNGKKTLVVERSAVVNMFGENAVFVCVDSHAKMIPVRVIEYGGMMAGIEASELEEGMKVVVKGNERLMDGQMVDMFTIDTGFLTDR